jgi:hypothetical protein
MQHEITFVDANGHLKGNVFDIAHKGLLKIGVKSNITTHESSSTKNVVCWGWRRAQALIDKGHNVLVFERGYIDRFKYYSIGWNGLNGHADFCIPDEVDGKRFNDNFEMKPWKDKGDYILIMGQVKGDASLRGLNLTDFYNELYVELVKEYKMPVFFRPHPAATERRLNFEPNIPEMGGDLHKSMSEAHLVVTFNSNSGVDAVLNGIPALSFDQGSMAFPVTGHNISDRIMPNREEWAHRLAHCQWDIDEISNGLFWEQIKCKLES